MELLLTKVRYLSDCHKDSVENANKVQIIGMSATLPNLDLLAKWLSADLYKTDFRPVPLVEKIKVGDNIFNNNFQFMTKIKPMINIPSDNDHLSYLSLETVVNGHSVLIFCPTKNWCEKVADTVAKEFFNLGKPSKVPDKNDRVRKFFFKTFSKV